MHRRVETTPKQQLAELRRAYERYAALAEQLKGGVNSAIDAKLQRALAQDACRIAEAYKKSVANSCARMENTRPSEGKATRFARMTTGSVMIVAVIAAGVFTITHRQELFRLIPPVGAEPAIMRNSAAATKDITPFVPAAVKPIWSAPALERTSTPLGPLQAPDGRQSVATAKSVTGEYQTAIHSKAHRKAGTLVRSFPVPSASSEAPPPVSAISAAAAPRSADSAASFAAPLSPTQTAAMSTQVLPTYPPDANRSVEQGVTQVRVSSSAAGAITDCRVVASSGSLSQDASACSLVQRNWQGPPLMRTSQPASGAIIVAVIWNLRATK